MYNHVAWWTDGLKCANLKASVSMFKNNLLGFKATRHRATVCRNELSRSGKWGSEGSCCRTAQPTAWSRAFSTCRHKN